MTTTAVPAVEPVVPDEMADFAYEWKLGWDAGGDDSRPYPTCPILQTHYLADSRRGAWRAGLTARRKALGWSPKRIFGGQR